jgi:hypothetical protein
MAPACGALSSAVNQQKMTERINIILGIRGMCELFAPHTEDRSTLDEIAAISLDSSRWRAAHDLFQRIRAKNLKASKRGDARLEAQYCFEEVCAKSLYNLSKEPAPFDADAPYWIIPNAIGLARRVGINEAEIVRIVAG